MIVEIKHRYTQAVIYTTDVADDDPLPIRTAIAKAILSDAYLSGAYLSGAYLSGADLSDAYLSGAYLSGAYLSGADLSGAYLSGADLSRAYLSDADLSGADLSRAYLSDADLSGADLSGADLSRAYLSGANLSDADLSDAYLSGADLSGADLSRANNVPTGTPTSDPPERATTDEEREKRRHERMLRFRERNPGIPVVENLDAKILAAIGEDGHALEMGAWHTCGTTHCRGGWAVQLAGTAGRKLEESTSPQYAATQIYRASTGRVPHFFASNERALEDIKACASRDRERAK